MGNTGSKDPILGSTASSAGQSLRHLLPLLHTVEHDDATPHTCSHTLHTPAPTPAAAVHRAGAEEDDPTPSGPIPPLSLLSSL